MLFCCPIAGHPPKTGAAAVATSSNNTQIPKTYGGFWKKPFSKKRSKKCRTVHRFSMALHHNAKMMCLKNAKTVFCKFAPLSACSAMAPFFGVGPLQSSSAALRGPLRGASLREPLCSSWAVQGYFFVFFQLYVPPLLPLFLFFPPSPLLFVFLFPLPLFPAKRNPKPYVVNATRSPKPYVVNAKRSPKP